MRILVKIKTKIRRKMQRTFCRHDWQFENVTNTRLPWPRSKAFTYICEKCGAHKNINCYDIEKRISEYGEKDNYDYSEETVLLPNGYAPMLVEYAGRDVGRAVQWHWKHEGVLISAYAYKKNAEFCQIKRQV